MYIDRFVAGVLATLISEVAVVVLAVIVAVVRSRRNGDNQND